MMANYEEGDWVGDYLDEFNFLSVIHGCKAASVDEYGSDGVAYIFPGSAVIPIEANCQDFHANLPLSAESLRDFTKRWQDDRNLAGFLTTLGPECLVNSPQTIIARMWTYGANEGSFRLRAL
jgi:hypothetical protein